MTKANMIAEIQALEAALWYDLAYYDSKNAPTDGNLNRQVSYEMTDPERNKKLSAWFTIHSLMKSLGIPASESWEHTAALELTHELFIKRQAAKGIFYGERGNQI